MTDDQKDLEREISSLDAQIWTLRELLMEKEDERNELAQRYLMLYG